MQVTDQKLLKRRGYGLHNMQTTTELGGLTTRGQIVNQPHHSMLLCNNTRDTVVLTVTMEI